MKTLKTMFAVALLVVAGAAGAGHKHNGHKQYGDSPRHDLFEYAKVVEVRPIYREVKVSRPVRECWEEPVYHTQPQYPKSAGGMLAGGLLGGIVGHQFGKGSGNKVATAVGTIIGAQIGHDAVNGHAQQHSSTVKPVTRQATRRSWMDTMSPTATAAGFTMSRCHTIPVSA